MNPSDYAAHDGLGLAQLIRDKAVSAKEVAEAALAAAARINPAVNAIIETYDGRVVQADVNPNLAGLS